MLCNLSNKGVSSGAKRIVTPFAGAKVAPTRFPVEQRRYEYALPSYGADSSFDWGAVLDIVKRSFLQYIGHINV